MGERGPRELEELALKRSLLERLFVERDLRVFDLQDELQDADVLRL